MIYTSHVLYLYITGDHIRVVYTFYDHYMLVTEDYNGDERLKVIHYTGAFDSRLSSKISSASVSGSTKGRGGIIKEDLEDIAEKELEVLTYKSPTKPYPTDDAIRRARTRLGENKYNAFFNNCETFVNWALTGEGKSAQGSKAAAGTIGTSMLAAGGIGAVSGAVIGTGVFGPIGTVAGGAIGGAVGFFGSGLVSLTGVLITKLKIN